MTVPTIDERDELLLSCRYGELEEVQQFVEKYGKEIVSDIKDENGNTVLHMVSGNGHLEVLNYLLTIVSPSIIGVLNNSRSSPLHWAALNSHLAVAKTLVEFPGGPGVDLIDIKNDAGRTPLGEAEMAGWDEGARWFVEVMKLDEKADPEDELRLADSVEDIEVEIEDANGEIARMSISRHEGP
ncbi:cytoplasmic protein [Rickenella mellea]|uniref:protein S-acyltransferase n=1 Tax=Rickenella mellea TaxID=50990 RepID=A0A4Y7PMN4_9AGAM|nr:cytoplasmic protein [Rickenella mellea]